MNNYKSLQNIKMELFDAPIEVKKSFNRLVSYFDKGKGIHVPKPRPRSYDNDPDEFWIEDFKFINKPSSDKNGPRVVESKHWKDRYKTKPAHPKKGLKFDGFEGQEMIILDGPFKTKEEAQKKLESMKK